MDREEFILTTDNISTRGKVEKDPGVILDSTVSWGLWLSKHGEAVDRFEWELPEDLDAEAEFSSRSRSQVWLSGGTAGKSYLVTNRIVTRRGRKKAFSFSVVCP